MVVQFKVGKLRRYDRLNSLLLALQPISVPHHKSVYFQPKILEAYIEKNCALEMLSTIFATQPNPTPPPPPFVGALVLQNGK
jgi:hypothetical protein